MAIATLTESEKYSTTTLDGKVIDILTKNSQVLNMLPFEEIRGNSETYDQIATDSTVAFYDPNDTWSENSAVISQNTVKLKILGGMVDIDNFLTDTHSDKISIQGTQLDNKTKALKNTFLDGFYYGDDSSNTKAFDGLQVLISSTTYNTVHAGSSTGTALSMAKLYEAIDLVTDFKPNCLLMSKKMRRLIQIYLDSIGDKFPTARDQYGNLIEYFGSLPIVTDDNILNTETASSGAYAAKTGGANTTIFVATFDPYGICGCQGPNSIQVIPFGELPDKDASRWKIKWYCGLKFKNLRAAAKVDGIITSSAVTA